VIHLNPFEIQFFPPGNQISEEKIYRMVKTNAISIDTTSVYLMGSGNVGKTTLLNSLRSNGMRSDPLLEDVVPDRKLNFFRKLFSPNRKSKGHPINTPHQLPQEATKGVAQSSFQIGGVEFSFFDFGGQHHYHH